MRGRTNIVQRQGAIVNGDTVPAEALEDIKTGSFVEVVYRADYGRMTSTSDTDVKSIMVEENLWAIFYERPGASERYLSLVALVDEVPIVVDTVFVSNKMLGVIDAGGGKVVCSTEEFVHVYDIVDQKLIKLFSFNFRPSGIYTALRSLYVDNQGNIYICTSTTVVYKYVKQTNGYVLSKTVTITPSGVSSAFFLNSSEILVLNSNILRWFVLDLENQTFRTKAQADFSSSYSYFLFGRAYENKIFVSRKSSSGTISLMMADLLSDGLIFTNLNISLGKIKSIDFLEMYGNGLVIGGSPESSVTTKEGYINYYLYDPDSKSFSFENSVTATQNSASGFETSLYVDKERRIAIQTNNGIVYYNYTVEDYEVLEGWSGLINGVKNYTGGKMFGFTQEGGKKGDIINVYVPYKNS